MKIRNIHPYGAVDVRIPTEPPTYLHMEAGEVVEVTDEQAASMLEQPVNFEAVTDEQAASMLEQPVNFEAVTEAATNSKEK